LTQPLRPRSILIPDKNQKQNASIKTNAVEGRIEIREMKISKRLVSVQIESDLTSLWEMIGGVWTFRTSEV
jgi:hypothetical protein